MKLRTAAACILSLAVSACVAAESGGSCQSTPVEQKTTVVAVPNYAEDATDDTAPQVAARAAQWSAYEKSVVDALRASPDPRDRAVAELAFMHFGSDSPPEAEANLKRAATAAPDDELVLWLAMTGLKNMRAPSSDIDDLVTKLESAEPDNAATWFEGIVQAGMRHDRAAVSAGLSRMSATSRFDNHIAGISELVDQVFLRYPVPDDYFDAMPSEARARTKEAMARTLANTTTTAMALPAFQFLINACRTDGKGRNTDRAADCNAIGHMMAQNSDSLIGSMIGLSVLRVSRTFSDDDVRMSRDFRWIFDEYAQHSMSMLKEPSSTDDMENFERERRAFQKDWQETGAELDAMRRALQRWNISLAPPDDWQEKQPRFTSEMLAQDAAYFDANTVDY